MNCRLSKHYYFSIVDGFHIGRQKPWVLILTSDHLLCDFCESADLSSPWQRVVKES